MGGKIDFHACHEAHITFVLEAGSKVKKAQILARHTNPALTMNIYNRTRAERLTELSERVGRAVLLNESTIGAQREAVGCGTSCAEMSCEKQAGGLIPPAWLTEKSDV